MLVYNYFIGDNQRDKLVDLQEIIYSYSISYMFQEIRKIYLLNPFVGLYLDENQIEKLLEIENYDHRLMQIPHDTLAAVFRYKCRQSEYSKELFELNEHEIKTFYQTYFIDTDFLKKIDKEIWYLIKRWLEFLNYAIFNHISMSREIAHSVISFNLQEIDKKKAWKASQNTRSIIKEIYSHIPWIAETK